MNSLLKKRLPGILVAGLVTLAVGAAGVTPAATASDATTSGLTKAQKKKKAKALKACKKKRNAKQRRNCVKNVNKRFKRLANKPKPTPAGKTWNVDVADPYMYVPNQLNIKVNDSILWNWKLAGGREAHDVNPTSIPSGLNRYDFKSQLTSSPTYTFKAKFTKPGTYSFVCQLHFQMTMNVNVSR